MKEVGAAEMRPGNEHMSAYRLCFEILSNFPMSQLVSDTAHTRI